MRRADDSRDQKSRLERSDSGWIGADPADDLEARLEAETEPFDERQPHVLTALGPVAPDALGVTLVGAWDRPLVDADGDPGTVLREHEDLYASGVRSLVDLGSSATAQGVGDLAWVSARSPIHIIAGREVAVEPSSDATASPRFGVVKIGSRDDIRGLARNLPMVVAGSTWLSSARGGLVHHDAFDRSRLTVIVDAVAPVGTWEPVLDAGVQVALIVPAAGNNTLLAACAAAVRDLMARGFGDRMLLGYTNDPVSLMERFPVALMEAGLTAVEVRRLLVDNPAQALTMELAREPFAAVPTE